MQYPPKKFPRNGQGRPNVIVPCVKCDASGRVLSDKTARLIQCAPCKGQGQRGIYYTRTTTFVDVLEAKDTLTKWKLRRAAYGLYLRRDLLERTGKLFHPEENKGAINALCEEAMDVADANLKSEYGTDMHTVTELYDAGLDVSNLQEPFKSDLAAYVAATRDLKHLEIEHPTVLDEFKVAGTPDRVFEYQGQRYIGDLKTGSIDLGILKISMQLAIYAHAKLYDPDTGERTEHGASTEWGLIFHVPFQSGTAELVWVNLEAGWEAVQVAREVHAKRRIKFDHITRPFA